MKIIGHRGAKGLAPENTLASFKAALEQHVDELEFDLRVTRDGIVVVNHDPFVADANDVRHVIKTSTLAQLHQTKPTLITFDDLLDELGFKTHLLVEIKPEEPTEPIVKILEQRLASGWPVTAFSICSFDQTVLRGIKAAMPQLELVVIENWSSLHARMRAKELGTKRLSMNERWLWRGFLRMMHKGGYQISPYTMNSPARAERWQPYLYGAITDHPDLFVDLHE
jgi:glycerophosphoryl diester phosphodiesterase